MDVAHHEVIHWAAKEKAFGVQPGDDITWLGAQAEGNVYSFSEMGLNGNTEGLADNVERESNPLFTHEKLRELPHNLISWNEQREFIERHYNGRVLIGDPPWSYAQGYRLAVYAYTYFGPEASEFFVRQYFHHRLSFAQMELAATVKKRIAQNYQLSNLSMPDLERQIVEMAGKTPVRDNVSYKFLEGPMTNGMIERLRAKGWIIPNVNKAQLTRVNIPSPTTNLNGGIDLSSANINLEMRNSSGEIKFEIDPAMLKQLQNASGFYPKTITIQSFNDLQQFFGSYS